MDSIHVSFNIKVHFSYNLERKRHNMKNAENVGIATYIMKFNRDRKLRMHDKFLFVKFHVTIKLKWLKLIGNLSN